MSASQNHPPQRPAPSFLSRLLLWACTLGALSSVTGIACAFFLWSLDAVTRFRFSHPWLIYLLPVGGVITGWTYHRFGKSVESGNNLLMDRIHEPGAGVPRRMAPLILFGTLVAHFFGGSAGREGTAVQMGGSIAAAFARWFRCDHAMVRVILMAGIAAGFAAVFGTPFAGMIFAIEVLTVGKMEYKALPACCLAALLADWTCAACGTHHTHYGVSGLSSDFGVHLLGQYFPRILLAAAAFGLASRLFATLSHGVARWSKARITNPLLRPALGGVAVIALFLLSGTPDYLGLGVLGNRTGAMTLPSFFGTTPAPAWAWLWKLLFTVVTLGMGFKGGEVTPLFFIGAALGNALAGLTGAPLDLFAALGFVAIFSGATKTPLACTLMAIELFGPGIALPAGCACLIAFLSSGPVGIYSSQKPGRQWRWKKA